MTLNPEFQNVLVSKISYKWRFNPVWHRMLYSSTTPIMATVGVKGLIVGIF